MQIIHSKKLRQAHVSLTKRGRCLAHTSGRAMALSPSSPGHIPMLLIKLYVGRRRGRCIYTLSDRTRHSTHPPAQRDFAVNDVPGTEYTVVEYRIRSKTLKGQVHAKIHTRRECGEEGGGDDGVEC